MISMHGNKDYEIRNRKTNIPPNGHSRVGHGVMAGTWTVDRDSMRSMGMFMVSMHYSFADSPLVVVHVDWTSLESARPYIMHSANQNNSSIRCQRRISSIDVTNVNPYFAIKDETEALSSHRRRKCFH